MGRNSCYSCGESSYGTDECPQCTYLNQLKHEEIQKKKHSFYSPLKKSCKNRAKAIMERKPIFYKGVKYEYVEYEYQEPHLYYYENREKGFDEWCLCFNADGSLDFNFYMKVC